MSEFCRACTAQVFGEEYADRNDMRHSYPLRWDLCEECGWGWFNQAGERIGDRLEDRPEPEVA